MWSMSGVGSCSIWSKRLLLSLLNWANSNKFWACSSCCFTNSYDSSFDRVWVVRGGVRMYFTILLFPTFLNISRTVKESLNVSFSPVTLFLPNIIFVFFLMTGMAWIANVSTISLFQQIKCMGRRIKSVLSYDIDLNGGESTSYPVSLTGLWRRCIRSQCGSSYTVKVVRNVLYKP